MKLLPRPKGKRPRKQVELRLTTREAGRGDATVFNFTINFRFNLVCLAYLVIYSSFLTWCYLFLQFIPQVRSTHPIALFSVCLVLSFKFLIQSNSFFLSASIYLRSQNSSPRAFSHTVFFCTVEIVQGRVFMKKKLRILILICFFPWVSYACCLSFLCIGTE